MHSFVTNLTAAALLTHALVGCYGHHPLSCLQCENVATVAASPCCHHDHDAPAESQSPAEPCECLLTCHGCVTLPPQKTQIDAAPIAATFDLAVVDQMADGQLFGAFSGWERREIHSAHQPPLRLHLLHQSLLI